MKIELDHIGVAVKNIQGDQNFYLQLGLENSHNEVVASEKVKVGMFELENDCRIELLEPTEPDSPVGKFIEKRGPGIHHICLRVSDIHSLLKKLKDSGVRLINETPKPGAHNCMVAFIHPSATGGVLIELSQKMT